MAAQLDEKVDWHYCCWCCTTKRFFATFRKKEKKCLFPHRCHISQDTQRNIDRVCECVCVCVCVCVCELERERERVENKCKGMQLLKNVIYTVKKLSKHLNQTNFLFFLFQFGLFGPAVTIMLHTAWTHVLSVWVLFILHANFISYFSWNVLECFYHVDNKTQDN